MSNLHPTLVDVDGIMTKRWTDPDTGIVYDSRRDLEAVRSTRRRRILIDFETMVREKTLGQDPWERLPGETQVQYNRFHVYLTDPHPKGRNMMRVAVATDISETSVYHTARKYHWILRAELFDRSVAEAALKEYRDQKVVSAQRQAKLGRKLQAVAMVAANRLIDDTDRLDTMSASEIAKIADAGTRIERLANSDPTDIVDKQHTIIWQGPQPAWAAPPVADKPQPKPLTPDTPRADDATLRERVRLLTTPKTIEGQP